MPKRKEPLVTNQKYHLFNRGVRKTDIFYDDVDYRRFISLLRWYKQYDYPFSMFLSQLKQVGYNPEKAKAILQEISRTNSLQASPIRIISWVLMPNHYHLLVEQNVSDGIRTYIHKVATAYAMYFNARHSESGSLFQGPFRAVLMETERELLHVSRYIHVNPLAANLIEIERLNQYEWSSFCEYKGNLEWNVADLFTLDKYFPTRKKWEEFTLSQFTEDDVVTFEESIIDDDFGWY